MKLAAKALALAISVTMQGLLGMAALAQEESPDPCSGLVRAWVDPRFGSDPSYTLPVDPAAESMLVGQINDLNAPYKSLQAAIDAVHAQLGIRKTKYIRFTDAGTTPTGPTGWSVPGGTMSSVSFQPPLPMRPPGSSNRVFTLAVYILDDDAAGPVPPPSGPAIPNLYFGVQSILTRLDGTVWWSNLQSEYR